MKDKLLKTLEKVSEDDLKEAFGRWMSGFNSEQMFNNFISILEEYTFEP